MRHAAIACAAAALAAGTASAQDFASRPGEGEILIEEWTVPYENSRPRDPYTIDGETVWFVGQRADYLGRFDVGTESFQRIDMRQGAGPHNVIVDEAGDPWYAGNRDAHIARYDVETETFDFVEMPDGHPRDPHTQVFDSNGDIWFTGQGANTISKLTLADGSVETIDAPTEGARPYGIEIAPDGTIWVALLGTNKLASVDPETMALTEHVLPREAARPRRLAITTDGRVWYVDYMEGWLGALDPADGSIEEWRAPGAGESRPYAAARDSQDHIWFVETGLEPNVFVGFDPETEAFFSRTPLPSGGGAVRHMQYYEPDGVIWFGADTNTIGRAVVEPAAE